MRHELGRVVRAPTFLEPCRSPQMLVRAVRARDLVVRDVADQPVRERILGNRAAAGRGRAPYEILSLEAVQDRDGSLGRATADRRDDLRREASSRDRRVLEHELLLGRQAVETCRDDSLHRIGKRELGHLDVALRQHPDVLLGVQRVAADAYEQLRERLRRRLPAERAPQQRSRLVVGERRERERQRVRLAPAPGGPPLEQLGPRRAEHEHRHRRRPLDEVLDEVEQAVVRPVHVLENEHERTLGGGGLDQAPPRRERVEPRFLAGPPVRADAHEPLDVRLDPAPLDGVGHQLVEESRQLPPRRADGVCGVDAGSGLHALAERPVRDPVAVRKRAPLPPDRAAPRPRATPPRPPGRDATCRPPVRRRA